VGARVVLVGACVLPLAIGMACGGSGKGATRPNGGDKIAGGGDDDGGGGGAAGDDDDGGGAQSGDDDGGGPGPAGDDDGGAQAGDDDDGGAPTGVLAMPRLQTSQPPDKMSEYLVKPAKAAEAKKNWPLAVTYYQALTEARGADSQEALDLANMWISAGEFARATEVLNDYIDTTPDAKKRAEQKKIRDNLREAGARNPFSREFVQQYASKEAVATFDLGRKAFKAGKYADAELYFRMGLRLDPSLAGFLRELGATYDKLKMADRKVYYYRSYLARSPFGKNADFARSELAHDKGALGKLTMKSALPCDGGVWLNAQKLPAKTKLPLKNLPMPPGRHKALCWNVGYEIAQFEVFDVEAGKSKDVVFNWAVIVNKLENPFGRIALEDALNPGTMRMLPLKDTGVGVPVPNDGHPLKVHLESMDRSIQKDILLRIQPGSIETVTWPKP